MWKLLQRVYDLNVLDRVNLLFEFPTFPVYEFNFEQKIPSTRFLELRIIIQNRRE
jgi:hypothetical protein